MEITMAIPAGKGKAESSSASMASQMPGKKIKSDERCLIKQNQTRRHLFTQMRNHQTDKKDNHQDKTVFADDRSRPAQARHGQKSADHGEDQKTRNPAKTTQWFA